MSANEVQVEGFKEADAALAKLPIELRGKTVLDGLRKAGGNIAREMKALCPIDESHEQHLLRESIKAVVREGESLYVIVGTTWPQQHGHLVEGAGGKDYHKIKVRHHSHGKPTGEFLKKQPFAIPAAEGQQEETLKILKDHIDKTVADVMAAMK